MNDLQHSLEQIIITYHVIKMYIYCIFYLGIVNLSFNLNIYLENIFFYRTIPMYLLNHLILNILTLTFAWNFI
jgi:hypothetical protein